MALDKLKHIIFSLTLPDIWKNELNEISQECKQITFTIVEYFYTQYQLIPVRISPSIEEGIGIFYKNPIKELWIEIGNDLEIAALINQDKHIIKSFDIDNFNFEQVYKEYTR